jgi:hypothetical protein
MLRSPSAFLRDLGLAAALSACTSTPRIVDTDVDGALPTCAEAMHVGASLASWDDLAPLVEQVRAQRFPELTDVSIELFEVQSDTDFFVSNLDLSTVGAPPLERHYRVLANPLMFPTPPPFSAAYAIIAHELAHVRDYTEMDTTELVQFGLWYAGGDTADYERATDEVTLELGCAEGLKAYRVWLYERLTDEALAAKRATYYTPEEIDAWVADHP